jgi:hypothetical protein
MLGERVRHYSPRMHVARGLRQAVVMVGAGVLGALVAAGVWWAVADGDSRVRFAVALMVIGGVLGLGGSSVFSRAETEDVRAFSGQGPDRGEPSTGESLTAVGVFPFASRPSFVAGSMLFGSG